MAKGRVFLFFTLFRMYGCVANLAAYVVADQRNNDGLPPGPVDGVCTYYGFLSESKGLNTTKTLLATMPGSWEWATMPHPLNHSSTVLLNCSDLLAKVGSSGYCRYCKEYAVCRYARCLKGAEVNDKCCNLLSDTESLTKCNDISLPYNSADSKLASCEFTYDLYDFGSGNICLSVTMAIIGLFMVLIH